MVKEEQSNGLMFGGLLAGALIGAGVGLAITPRNGEANRRALELKAKRLALDLRHSVIETTNTAQVFVGEKASQVQQVVSEKATQVQQAVSATADNVKASASDVANTVRSAAETGVENARQASGIVADTVRQKAGDVRQATGGTVGNVKQKVDELRGASPNPITSDDVPDSVVIIPVRANDQPYSSLCCPVCRSA